MSRIVTKEVLVDAPPDVVWRALTEADQLTRWFPVDARVEPGLGGSVWLSWGGGVEGQAPITAWEPNRHLQWTETRGPVRLAIDFHVEARGGKTLVRLVQSGFGASPDWDDEFHMVEGGWSYFMSHLRWYLERHRGIRRDLISFRERVPLSRTEAFARLVGPKGLFVRGSLRAAEAGESFGDTPSEGSPITGTVVSKSPGTGQMGLTIREINDAILFLEMEPDPDGARAGFWLSTYGLSAAELVATDQLYERLYRQALGLPAMSAPRV